MNELTLKDIKPNTTEAFKGFEATPVTGTFGATITNLQLVDTLDNKQLFDELYRAWVKYQVLFFREQELTPVQHLELGKKFGKIQKEGYAPSLQGHEGVWVQEYPDLYSGVVADINWHADSSFRAVPTRGSLLYALDVPVSGGDTTWADQCAVYNNLSTAWQNLLEGLTSIHDNLWKNWQRVLEKNGAKAMEDVRKWLPPSEHPMVCTHPESGRKFVFASELMTREIVGMNERESRAILDFLHAEQTRPEYQARFHWEPKSLVLWDNFSTLHRGIFDFGQSHRLMHRVSFNTDWIC
ncbi:MAG: TauD/TfdA family dioxygenase [Gammaproteobacteria bacterium]|nr:TauD/TfdA family dioxygenase [Gammaproteobacteria bacterium]